MNELLIKNAADKLRREMKSKNMQQPATLIQDNVAEALDYFCKQEPKLAKAIIESKKTFAECCENILKDTKAQQYISDLKAYSRAVEFYIEGAKVDFTMNIILEKGGSTISLMDFL